MTDIQSPGAGDEAESKLGQHQAARLAKLHKLESLGVDPWGHYFPQRTLSKVVRERAGEVKFRLESGTELALPNLDGEAKVDYRQWKSDQGKGEEIGPKVRVAGRIVLMRPTGKLIFINLRDWTGDIQIFIGKNQVGDQDFEIAQYYDLGDWIGVDGRLGRTNTGELTVFAEALHFMCKTMEPPPEKHVCGRLVHQPMREFQHGQRFSAHVAFARAEIVA